MHLPNTGRAVNGARLLAPPLPNLPWQERLDGSDEPVWRLDANPIIKRRPFAGADRVYNSAVVPWKDGFAGVFRNDGRNGLPFLHRGFSEDGLAWEFDPDPIAFHQPDGSIKQGPDGFGYQYDPRVVAIDGRHYVLWCNDFHGPTIGLGYTDDFEHFHQLENAFVPYNRNGVLFPKKFGDDYVMLSRPSDSGHTPFGDIYLSRSKDLIHWGRHRFLMGAGGQDCPGWWSNLKIGAGPAPIETSAGWLLLYHAVTQLCNGLVYSMGVALLDRNQPDRVITRGDGYVLTPEMPYETTGLTPNVIFPTAALCDGETGRIAVYYGGADTFTSVAFTRVDLLLDWLSEHGVRG